MQFSAVDVAGCADYVSLNNIFGNFVLLLLFKLLIVLHYEKLAFGACIKIDNFLHLFLYTADFFVFKQHVELH